MPGLAGMIRRDRPLRDPRHIITRFEDVGLVNGVKYRYRSFCTEHAVILNTLTGLLPPTLHQPAVDPSGKQLLFLEGEIFNLDEIRNRTHSPVDVTPCELLLALFMKRGEEFVRLINGEFNIVLYHRGSRRLDLFCDHVASMPMYCMEQPDCFLFASEKKSLLAVAEESPEIDPVGLLQIVAHRHNLDERTFLRGVTRLMPGAQLTYQRGRLQNRRRDLLNLADQQPRRQGSELRDDWTGHLQEATRSRVQGKENIFISLSGGLDSRAIACALPRDLRPLWSRTRAVDGSLEAATAAEIAGRLGFEHLRENPMAVRHSNIIPKIAWRTECETPFMNALSIANHAALRNRCHFMAGGWLGDVSAGAHISAEMLVPMPRSYFVQRTFKRYTRAVSQLLPKIFSERFLAKTLPMLQEAFEASFRNFNDMSNIRAYEVWDLYQRQRRQTTSSMPVDSYAFEKIRPFYDKNYLNFTLTLPTEMRFGQILYQAMILQLGPEIADVPSANTGLRLRSALLGNLGNKTVTLAHRAITRRIRKVRPAYCNGIERRRAEDLGAELRNEAPFRILIERFLKSSDFDSSIFNRNGISSMLSEHYEGIADHSWPLGQVATLASGLPWFLQKTLRCPEEAEPLGAAEEISGRRYGIPRRDEPARVKAPEARPAPAR